METKISGYQATLLLIITIVSTTIIFLPTNMINIAFQDAWISVLLLVGITLLFSPVHIFLCKKMGKTDLITFTRNVFGNFFTIVVGLIIIITFIILSGIVVRETTEILATVYYLQTPLWFLNIIIIFTASILVYYGLEAIARSLEIIFYVFLIFFLITFILLIKDMSLSLLKPVLENGFKPVLGGITPGLVFFSETFVILILNPHISDRDRISSPLIIAIIVTGLLLSILILSLINVIWP